MSLDHAIDLLRQAGLNIKEKALGQLDNHASLVREYNEIVSLVSARDIDLLNELHIPDSLSLAPYVVKLMNSESTLLDVGTGGGFPAIPLKILFPDIKLVLIERRQTRAGFLRNVVASLGLNEVTIQSVDFPREYVDCEPAIVTARAVEKAERVCKGILQILHEDSSWLCQSGGPEKLLGEKFHVERRDEGSVIGSCAGHRFHVEPVEDEWAHAGLRRGSLYIVRPYPDEKK